MGASIFHIFDWNTVEPLTFIVTSWWLMLGSGYYLFTKSDFSYTSVFGHFKEKKFNKLVNESKFDLKKKDFLTAYIDELDMYDKVFTN